MGRRFGKVGRWLRIILGPVASALSKSHVLNTTQTGFLLEKNLGGETIGHCFKQSAIVSIVLSFVFGNLKGQQGFFAGVGGWVKLVSEGWTVSIRYFNLS